MNFEIMEGFKKALYFLVVLVIVLALSPKIYAVSKTLNLKNESINPGSAYYLLKRAWEKFYLSMPLSTELKVKYEMQLLEIRLAELNYIGRNRMLDEFENS